MIRGPTLLALLALAWMATPASASLNRTQLNSVAAAPAAGAAVLLDLGLADPQGRPVTIGEALGGRPALLLLADYRCSQLCGSLLGIAADALHDTGLQPTRDVSLLVVGFNPEADGADALRLRDQQLARRSDLQAGVRLFTGSPANVSRLQSALGFTAVRDDAAARFAHPADLYVLTADGRISRVLNGLSVDADTLRLALVEAGQGRIGSFTDRLHVLCYGLDPLSGAANDAAQLMLRLGAAMTLIGAGTGLAVLIRHRLGAPERRA